MNKETLEKDLLTLLEEAERMNQQSELTLATAKFLRNEEQKLGAKIANDSLSDTEEVLLIKQIVALQKRIQQEIELFNADVPKIRALDERLEYLKTIFITSQAEE